VANRPTKQAHRRGRMRGYDIGYGYQDGRACW
jgi:hypothetical protein